MAQLMQDVQYALRQLRKAPGFTLTAILTLALGIGATTAMYSVVSEVLLRPLPYPGQEQLIGVGWETAGEQPEWEQTGETADFLREHSKSLADIGVADDGPLGVNFSVGDGKPLSIRSQRVSAGYLPTLGVPPMLGRWFTADDDHAGGAPVAVLSYGLWKQALNGDANAVGHPVRVNGDVYTVIGVMPASFATADSPDLWQPLRLGTADPGYYGTNFMMIARLKPGMSLEQSRAELKTLTTEIYSQYPHYKKWYPTGHALPEEHAWRLRDVIVSGARTSLLSLLFAVVMVLLVACLNLAGLMTARAFGRQREVALRMALGAPRRSMVRLLMMESLLLALAGSVGAVGVSRGLRELWKTISPVASLSSLNPSAAAGSEFWAMLGFALAVGCATALMFGLLPALGLLRHNAMGALGGQVTGTTVSTQKMGRMLMIAQVALATMLLSAGALLLGTFLKMRSIPTGVVAKRLDVLQVNLKGDEYANTLKTVQFVDKVQDGLRRIPGVAQVATVNGLPLQGGLNTEGRPAREGKESNRSVEARFVTPGYFHTVGTPLLAGRDVTAADRADDPPVALVNEQTVQKWWHGKSPIGEYVVVGGESREIIGVVANAHDKLLADAIRPTVYEPYAQVDDKGIKAINGWFPTSFVIRVEGDAPIATEVQRALHDADPEVPVGKFSGMQSFVDETVAAPRFFSWMAGGFAGFALLLTAVGLFGLLSYQVGLRTREIGLRMAVGAGRGQILRLVLQRGIALTIAGLCIGAAGSVALRRVVVSVLTDTVHTHSGDLSGVLASGSVALGCAAAALLATAMLSSYLPARRAASIEPTEALRTE